MRPPTRLALLIAFFIPCAAAGQTSGRLPRVFELPASTRAMALGDAYMMNAGHADAIFYHPSLLTGSRGFGIDLQRWGAESSSTTASAAMPWLGGAVGVGLRTLQYGAPGTGVGAAPSGQDHLFTLGTQPVSERVATLAYAREVFGVDFGVAGNLVDERVGVERQNVVMMDVGASRQIGPVTVGLTVHDIGEKPVLDTGARPGRVTLGAGRYGQQLGILDVGYTAALHYTEERTTVSGGVEVGYWPITGRTFVARIGLQDPLEGSDLNPVSVGFAFWGDNVTLEWAFRPYGGDESGTHRFGVRWR